MASGFVLLIVLAVLLLVVVPVLSISAFVRVRRLERTRRTAPDPAAAPPENLRRLELRVQGIEKAVERLYARLDSAAQLQSLAQSQPPAPSIAQTPAQPPLAPQPPAERIAAPASPPPIPAPPSAIPPATPSVHAEERGAKHIVYTAPHAASRESEQLENVVAGKWLNYVGIIAVLFAVAFFIEYAFENNWIGPAGRIAIGIFCGAALLVGSAWLLHRGYEYFSEGIAALGAAVLYLSLWGGWHYYRLFSSGQAFAGMIAVTAAMTIIALGRNSQRLALLALIGGFLTPELVSTGADHQIVLFTYNAILSAGMLALERFRKWNWLPPLAFAATEIYFWGWYTAFYTPAKLVPTLAFALLFFLLFAALPMMRARRDGRLEESEYSVAIGNVAVFLLALRQMLWPNNRWALTFAFLALAAIHLLALRVLPAPSANSKGRMNARWLFAALALVCISLAVPARLDTQFLTIAWAIEGLLLVWGGAKISSMWLRAAGLLFFAITALRLITLRIPAGQFLWNQRFMTYAIAVACFALACIFVRQIAAKFDEGERIAFAALAVAVNVYALIALSLEIWDFLAPVRGLGASGGFLAQQLSLSILWTLYATALIILGMARRAAILRWQALTLFGIVVLKVFFFDLSELSRFYRILSFLVLGILLLAVSFLYQRRSMARKEKPS
jgi:uncharacterized membrane protein